MGPRHEAAEYPGLEGKLVIALMLQWGRGTKPRNIVPDNAGSSGHMCSFNGAAARSRGI